MLVFFCSGRMKKWVVLSYIQTEFGAHRASYTVNTGGESGRGVKLTTLIPRLRMDGAVRPLHRYILMAFCLVTHRDNFTFTFALSLQTAQAVQGDPEVKGKKGKFVTVLN
jgi:hypothetical protein